MNDSQHHDHQVHVPKGILISAAVLISLTIAAVLGFRMAGVAPMAQVPSTGETLQSRALRFEDNPEGTVTVFEVIDGSEDQILHVVQPGEGGFIRGILRSLARSRRASGIGREHPFLLKAQANGALLLEDPQTGQIIFLQAFGPTNIESFQTLLSSEPVPQ